MLLDYLICCRTCSLHLSAAVHAIITRFMILAGLLSTKCCRRSSFFSQLSMLCLHLYPDKCKSSCECVTICIVQRAETVDCVLTPVVCMKQRTCEPTNKSYKVNICSRWRKKRPIGYCESKRCYHALVLHIANSCTITQLCLFSDFITFYYSNCTETPTYDI